MATADPAFDFLPGECRARVLHQIGLSSIQFLSLPIMDRHGFGSCRKVVPQVFYELKLL